MSRPDERLVEGVDYDHGDYDAVADGEFTGYGDHEDRPWADDDRDCASLPSEPDEADWDSPHSDGNAVEDAEG